MNQTFVCAACARINGPSADTCSKCGGNEFVREELDLHAVVEFVAVVEPPAVTPWLGGAVPNKEFPKRIVTPAVQLPRVSRRQELEEVAFPKTVHSRKRWRA